MISVNLNDNSISSIAKQLYLELAVDGKATIIFPNIAGTERLIAIKLDMSFDDDININGNRQLNPIIEAQGIAFTNALYDAETMLSVTIFCNGEVTKGIIVILSSLHHLGVSIEVVKEIRLILIEVLRAFWAIRLDNPNIPELMRDMYKDYPLYELDEDEMVSQKTYHEPYDGI